MADLAPLPVQLPDELSPLDYLMHRGEAQPATRSAFLGVELLDRPADWPRLREAMDRASRVVIRMRQKVVVPPVPVTPARWVVDPDFDLNYHLRRVALPGPGTLRQLLDLAEVMLAAPLDTSRSLWEVTYVEGLEGNRAALLTKVSHAVTDGLGGIALFEQIYDTERDAGPRPMPPVPIPREISGTDLVRDSLRRLPDSTLEASRAALTGLANTAVRVARQPMSAITETAGLVASARRVLGPLPAPPSPLLRRRSLALRSEVLEVPLDDLRRAARAAGGSVNDAYLAALCGALGRYHEALGVPVDTLPLAIPVSLRGSDDPAAGNRFAGVTIAAPVGEGDPAERIRLIREQVVARRSEPAIGAVDWMAPVLGRLPDAALQLFTDRIARPDIQASNVPGYPGETFLAGSRVDRQYGMGPVPGVAMMAVLVSRAGTCTLTARYDTMSFTDSGVLGDSLKQGFAEVVGLGQPAARSPAAARRAKARQTSAKAARSGTAQPGTATPNGRQPQ